jgi:hypothetical protein
VANDGGAAPVAEVEALIARGRALPVLLDKECQVRPHPPLPLAQPSNHSSVLCSTWLTIDNLWSLFLHLTPGGPIGALPAIQAAKEKKSGWHHASAFWGEVIDVAVCTRLPPPIRECSCLRRSSRSGASCTARARSLTTRRRP